MFELSIRHGLYALVYFWYCGEVPPVLAWVGMFVFAIWLYIMRERLLTSEKTTSFVFRTGKSRIVTIILAVLLMICVLWIELPKHDEMNKAITEHKSYCPLALLKPLYEFKPFASSILWLKFHLLETTALTVVLALLVIVEHVDVDVKNFLSMIFHELQILFVLSVWANSWNVINTPYFVALTVNFTWLTVLSASFLTQNWIPYIIAMGTPTFLQTAGYIHIQMSNMK